MMQHAALACAPANAHAEVLARAHFVTPRAGGHGAVRDLCDLLLSGSGHYQALLASYTR
jgi:3-deoxy-D-manno-octulosonate 8-phosphate phosphatase (KDO 8-P phosphatase)